MPAEIAVVLQQLVPHLLPPKLESSQRNLLLADASRYAVRLASFTGLQSPTHDFEGLKKQVLDFVARQGSDASRFAALLKRLSGSLASSDQVQLLSHLRTLCEYAATASSALPLVSLSDATNRDFGTTAQAGVGAVPTTSLSHANIPGPTVSGLPSLAASAQSPLRFSLSGLGSPIVNPAYSTIGATLDSASGHDTADIAIERQLAQDVLHACQGLDGVYVSLGVPGDHPTSLTEEGDRVLTMTQRGLLLDLATLGLQLKRLKQLVGLRTHAVGTMKRGLVHQAFAAAIVQNELKEFYRLMAMLQALALRPRPDLASVAAGSTEDTGYLTLRRLRVWLKDPLRRMRLLVSLAEACDGKKGGQLASVVYASAQSGDGFRAGFSMRLLRFVCVPLYAMIHQWVTEGELDDPFDDFFVAATATARDEAHYNAWHDGYELRPALVPTFIDDGLARAVLRAGKSINFLRELCGDVAWVQDAARTAHLDTTALEQNEEPVAELRRLVDGACARVDARLLGVLLGRLAFLEHASAIKALLLFGQGDFASELLRACADLVDVPAAKVMQLELNDRLKKAMDASNVKEMDEATQERLHLPRVADAGAKATLGDTLCLRYAVRGPIACLLDAPVMSSYEQISAFLFKIKTMEYNLQRVWLVLRSMEGTLQRSLRGVVGYKHAIWVTLQHVHRLHSNMSTFCQNLQAYVTFEVIEGAWAAFEAAVKKAQDVDELMAVHGAYQQRILSQALLDEQAQDLRAVLGRVFDCARLLVRPIMECGTVVAAQAAILRRVQANVARGEWGAAENPKERISAELAAASDRACRRVSDLNERLGELRKEFVSRQAQAVHLDLRFLVLQLRDSDEDGAVPRPARTGSFRVMVPR